MLILCIGNIYRKWRAKADEKHMGTAAEPKVDEKDLEKSLVLENPCFSINPTYQQHDTPMPAFDNNDTVVHRDEERSPQKQTD